MRLLTLLVVLVPLVAGLAGCGSSASADGANNPPAKRLTEAEFEARSVKKGGAEGN